MKRERIDSYAKANELFGQASDYQFKQNEPEKAYLIYQSILKDYPGYERREACKAMIDKLEKSGLNLDDSALAALPDEERERLAQKTKAAKEKAELKKQVEAMKESIIMSSCPAVDGYVATKQFGLVFGECVYYAGFLKSLSATMDNLGDIYSSGDKELSRRNRRSSMR